MDQELALLTVLGMAAATYLPRFLPTWLLSSRPLSPTITTWLGYVPVAVLSAMLLPTLLVPEKELDLSLDNLFLLAALPTFIVAGLTRSLLASVLTGVGLVAAARYFLGW
jgi:branched-subunit amino acid transport protein